MFSVRVRERAPKHTPYNLDSISQNSLLLLIQFHRNQVAGATSAAQLRCPTKSNMTGGVGHGATSPKSVLDLRLSLNRLQ